VAKAMGRRGGRAVLFLIPSIALLLVFNYYPFFSALFHSLFRWDGIGEVSRKDFVGLGHFMKLLSDRDFYIAARNVGILLFFQTLKALTVPLLVAELVFAIRNVRVGYFYRVMFVLPMVVPMVVIILIWRGLYIYETGFINQFLRVADLGEFARSWLADKKTALGAIIFMGFPWVGALPMLLYLAGLMDIPESVVDAAEVDGARGWRRFFHIDLPLLRGQMKLVLVLVIIQTLQQFEVPFILTDGGPGKATMVPGLLMYHYAFRYRQLGYASAIAVYMFLAMLILTNVNMRAMRQKEEA